MHSDALMEVLAALGGGNGGTGGGGPSTETLYGLAASTARAPCVPLLFRITQLAGEWRHWSRARKRHARAARKQDEKSAELTRRRQVRRTAS